MIDAEGVKSLIRDAFAHTKRPGRRNIRGSNQGDEPFRLEQEFRGVSRWENLRAEFIDQSPDGLGSSLSFFSHQAFCFFIPAYLIADVDGKLANVNPKFHLTHSLTDATRTERINSRRGTETWFDYALERFGSFSTAQAAAIVEYLRFVQNREPIKRNRLDIDEALRNYWLNRATDPNQDARDKDAS